MGEADHILLQANDNREKIQGTWTVTDNDQ